VSEPTELPHGPDPEALAAYWTEIYTECETSVFFVVERYLRGRTICGLSAEDVVAQTFEEKIAKGLPADPDDRVGQLRHLLWLAGCRSLNLLRDGGHFGGGTLVDRATDDEPVESVVSRALMAAAAMASLDVLDERRRYAFVERVLEETPAKDIGVALGCTPQRVPQLVAEAVSKLRAIINGRAPGGGR
jgi:DNA-directed RNA polymerase specialized sigma24 family protein